MQTLLLPQTAERVLAECRTAGISLSLDGEALRYHAETGALTEELRETIKRHKPALITLLRSCSGREEASCSAIEHDEPDPIPSEEGKALLAPFLPVIVAAHHGELPKLILEINGKPNDIADYVCRTSAGIWYGIGLDDARLSDRLENLRKLQEWYEDTQ